MLVSSRSEILPSRSAKLIHHFARDRKAPRLATAAGLFFHGTAETLKVDAEGQAVGARVSRIAKIARPDIFESIKVQFVAKILAPD